jgi:ABC-type transport system substrate-binding protein
VTAASANHRGVSYTISPKAFWYWGGRKVPVTYKDFVYTLQQALNPNNDIPARDPFNHLDPTHFTHRGLRHVTFYWRTKNCSTDFPCSPFANWQALFSGPVALFPSFALKGMDFNKIWTTCVCGSDGKPVSDGPFYMAKYTPGQGITLRRNPYWGGKKPGLNEVDFRFFPDHDVLFEAFRHGGLDALNAGFNPQLPVFQRLPGVTVTPDSTDFEVELIEFREGSAPGGPGVTKGASNELLRAPWMRRAIALSVDRRAVNELSYHGFAHKIAVDQNLIFYPGQAPYRPDFVKWDYNLHKALAILKRHCVPDSGPAAPNAANTNIWRCDGSPATFRWSWRIDNPLRGSVEQLTATRLKSIGIEIDPRPQPANVYFGPNGIKSGDFDITEFAFNGPTGDPGDFYDQYRCRGSETGFCSQKVDALLSAANSELNPRKRIAEYQKADKLLAGSVPALPLVSAQALVAHKSNLVGMEPGPAMFSTMENWHWKR